MIPVDQTVSGFTNGDCMRACVASVFELPIEEVPNFMEDGDDYFSSKLGAWCFERNLIPMDCQISWDDVRNDLKDIYIIAHGQSPRSSNEKCRHAVIYKGNKMVHDPHPAREGVVEEEDILQCTMFMIKDYSKLKEQP